MPEIQLENCTRCLKCVKDCPSDAIDIEKGSIVEDEEIEAEIAAR